MATAIQPVRQAFKGIRDGKRANRIVIQAQRVFILPESFESALRLGWAIQSEKTTLEPTKRHRHGVVILAMKGQEQKLAVSYTASVRDGYQFSKPELFQ